MRKLLSRRWRGIPVGIIAALLALVLISGGVLATYAVITGTVTVQVNEAFMVGYSQTSATGPWTTVADGFTIPVTGAHPGDCMDIWVRITNASSNSLWGTVSVVPRTPAAFDLTYHGTYLDLFVGGVSVPGGGERIARVRACVADDAAAPLTYTIDISVLRGSQP